MNISFDNTAIAFALKTDKEIRRAYRLFKIIENPFLVRVGTWATLLALKLHLPLNWLLKPTLFQHFCGGESVEDCEKTINKLQKSHIGTILDYAAEGIVNEIEFEKTTLEILKIIEKAALTPAIPFAVFKMTGIARLELLELVQSKKELTDAAKKSLSWSKKELMPFAKELMRKMFPYLLMPKKAVFRTSLTT